MRNWDGDTHWTVFIIVPMIAVVINVIGRIMGH